VLGAGLAALGVLAARFEPPPAPSGAGKAAAAGFAESLDLLPFARLTPGRPAALLAAAALTLAAVLAARASSRRLGGAAPLWIGAWIFGSVVWIAVLWTPAAVVALSASVVAFALAFGAEQPPLEHLPEVFEPPGGRWAPAVAARWLLVGGLLGLLAASQPLYLPLLLPAALAAPHRRRHLAWGALGVGAAAVVAAGLAVGGVEPWLDRLGKIELVDLDMRLAGWNALYLLAGRNVGILLGFFPLLLLALAFRAVRARRWLLAAVGVIAALFLLLHPFDFYGGPGALGNRLFLPLYGALWLTAARPARGLPALLALGLGAALLWPLARAPLAHPLLPGGGYRHASGWASRHLPFETSQRHLPVPEIYAGGARLRFLDDRSWALAGSGGASLRILGGAETELLLASRAELGSLLLEFERRASSRLEVGGGELGETILRPDGGVAFEVLLGKPRAVHPAWWSDEPHHFYLLELRLPGARPVPIAFSLAPQERPAWKPEE
jgi:hypothetical protein